MNVTCHPDAVAGRRRFDISALVVAFCLASASPASAQPGPSQPAPSGIGQQASVYCAKYTDKERELYQQYMRVGGRQNVEENFTGAEQSFRLALAQHQKSCGRDDPGQIDALMHLAMQMSNQSRFDEAAINFKRADALAALAGVDPLVRARLAHYQANDLANKGSAAEAIAKAEAAERAYIADAPELVPLLGRAPDRKLEATGFGVRGQRIVDPRAQGQVLQANAISPAGQLAAQGVAESMRLRALLATGAGDGAKGRELANRAVALLEAVGIDPGGVRWRAIRVAGLAAAQQQLLGPAGADLGDSARGIDRALKNSQPAGKTYLESGKAQLDRGNLDAALFEFRRGAQVLRAERNGVSAETARPYLDALLQRIRTDGEAGLLSAEMFDAAQLIRGGLTANFLAAAALRMGDGNREVAKLQALESELISFAQRRDNAVNNNRDAGTIDGLTAQLEAKGQERDTAETEVRRTFPNYFQLVQGQPTAKQVLDALRPDEGFLQIVLGPRSSYGFLLRGGRVSVWPIDLTRDQAEQTVAKLRAAFLPDAKGDLPTFDVALAHDLHKRLLGSVAADVGRLKSLMIAAGGALQSLPFALLVRESPPTINEPADYKKVAWLAKDLSMSYVPAPQSFVLLRTNASVSRALNAYIGYGGFAPLGLGAAAGLIAAGRPPGQALLGCDADARELASLPPLDFAEGEVAYTAKQLGVGSQATRLGRAFSRTSVVRGGLERFKIVHLAAHALLPSELRCLDQPVILTGQGVGAEAMLRAEDIAAMRLDADMVVLSACNTAGPDGKSAGEAFSGLARSFFTAGTRGLMASHWNVGDDSTAFMMVNVLSAVGKGGRPATVLHDIQLLMLREAGTDGNPAIWAHPFFWAPFVFAGNA